jgi:signal transduction histidine kinase
MVLYQGNVTHPANVISSEVLRETFASAPGSQFFEEYIDEDRLHGHEDGLADFLREKYRGKKMDLVIGEGWPSLKFLLHRGEEIWPGTPKVFYFIDSREVPATLPPNMTGVVGVVDYTALLDLALRLRPNTKHVFYIGGVNEWEEVWRGFAEQDFKQFADRVDVTFLNHLPLPELLERLGQLPENSVVIYAEMLRDASGHVYVPARICPLVASASNAPVFGPFDTFLGCGIVGGVILDTRDLATQTARLGLRVLERGTASGIPVETSRERTMIDWRQLQRWNISERSLPSGAIVQFRAPSLWEEYKWYVLAGLTAIVAQLALIVILIVEMHRRKKSDLAINNLSGRIINAGEEERKRIARELHDDIGQRLSLLSIELDGVGRDLPTDKGAERKALNQSLQQINELVTDVHNLSHQLHSSKLQMLGLEVALREVCKQLERQHEIEIQLTTDGVPFPLREDLALCFYRVAQEALSNSVKHSGSGRAQVSVAGRNGTLKMTIKDYGTGFDPNIAGAGLGLATMRERLRLVEGKLVVNSRLGGGTEVTAQARLDRSLRQTTAA